MVCYVNKGEVVKTVQGDQNYQLSYVRVPEERLHKELTSLPLASLSGQPEDRLYIKDRQVFTCMATLSG